METKLGTITINAAFLREIKEDNVHLRNLLEAAARALGAGRTKHVRPQALAELLGRLRDQVATHFALEEFFGYFDDAVDVAPHLSVEADVLRAQHESLYLTLCEIADDAEKLVYHESPSVKIEQVASNFRSFYEKFTEHDALEAEMIMDAFYQDIGAVD